MSSLIVNARFATRPLSGVDRVAVEMTRALLDITFSNQKLKLIAETPNASIHSSVPFPSSIDIVRGKLSGQIWEQAELPSKIGDGWLYSPCNTGPLVVRRQIVLIHDAQPFLEPQAYSAAFRNWYRLLLPLLARRAAIVTTISEYSKAQLEHFGITPPGKAQVIPNGCDHILSIRSDSDTLDRHGLRQGGYVLAIGNLSPHKNLAMLMQAAAARPAGAPELVIAGGGNPRVFADAGLQPPTGVRLLGRVSDGELKALYENAIAFAFPSRTEGFGLPPLEAMLCGCPVIASTGGAIPEVCGDAAWLVPPDDLYGWMYALTEVAGNAALRERLKAAGYARAKSYTWRSAALSLLQLMLAHSATADTGSQT